MEEEGVHKVCVVHLDVDHDDHYSGLRDHNIHLHHNNPVYDEGCKVLAQFSFEMDHKKTFWL